MRYLTTAVYSLDDRPLLWRLSEKSYKEFLQAKALGQTPILNENYGRIIGEIINIDYIDSERAESLLKEIKR